LKKIWEFFGMGGEKENGLPPKEQGRRNLWLIGLAGLGVLLLVFSGVRGENTTSGQQPLSQEESGIVLQKQFKSSIAFEENKLSENLCNLLSRVEGAGRVQVAVKITGSTNVEYAVNSTVGKKTTQEQDQSGGTRLTTENTESGQLVMNRTESGGEQPVVERETAPRVVGVLVVAEGAGDALVKARLFEAVKVALGIEPQKIAVVPMEGGE
jgi:stage III sporulation protein AG